MDKLDLKPGVLTGNAVRDLFAYCKEAGCALPAVNVIGSNSANAAMAAARAARAPIIIQISHTGSQFFAGKTLDNGRHQASIAGAIAGAYHVRALASVYGVPVVMTIAAGTRITDLSRWLGASEVVLPTLAERPEDVTPLASHFCRAAAERHAVEVARGWHAGCRDVRDRRGRNGAGEATAIVSPYSQRTTLALDHAVTRKEKGAPIPSVVVVATGSGRERSVPTVNSDA